MTILKETLKTMLLLSLLCSDVLPDMTPKVSLFGDIYFSTKAEILKYTRMKIEMLRFVKFYKLRISNISIL